MNRLDFARDQVTRPADYVPRHRMAPWYVRLAAWVVVKVKP